jgi:hypothetical protein
MQRSLLILALILFSALSAKAMLVHGYLGIMLPLFQSFAAGQVLADLVIALALILIWMWHDAKARGRIIWPWIVITLLAGSFGPLLYLLTQKQSGKT